jgi:hypothetical protein
MLATGNISVCDKFVLENGEVIVGKVSKSGDESLSEIS